MLDKNAYIRKLPNGKYRVLSRKHKNLGTFDSREKAEKHLKEVEYFKHKDNKRKLRKKAMLLLIASSSKKIDLLPSNELKGDDYFIKELDNYQEIVDFFPKLWSPEYNEEFRFIVWGAIKRGKEQISHSNSEIRKFKKDIVLTLKRENSYSIVQRGDYRYDSNNMTDFLLNTEYDLLPPIVGSTGFGQHLLDGHHRLRAYQAAGIAPLILEIKIQNSLSYTPKIIAIVEDSAMEKK